MINTTQSPALTLLFLSLSLPMVLRYDTKAKEIHTQTPSPYYIFPSLPTVACSKKTNNFFLPLGGEYVYWFLWQQIYHSCVMGESVLSSLHLLSNHQYYQRKSLIAASNEGQVTSSVLAYTDWLTSASRWHLVQVKADYLDSRQHALPVMADLLEVLEDRSFTCYYDACITYSISYKEPSCLHISCPGALPKGEKDM